MTGNEPIDKVRCGRVVASIWENTHKNKEGKDFTTNSVSLQKGYTDKEGNYTNLNSSSHSSHKNGSLH